MAAKRERLARRRKTIGLTQEQLADQLGTERSTIWRWEHGLTGPLPEMRPKLARALDLSPDELAELIDLPPATVDRIDFALRNPSSVDPASVSSLRHYVDDLEHRYDRMPSASLIADTGQALGQIRFLTRQSLPNLLHRDLYALEATAATLMGQLVWDASQRHDHGAARAHYSQAVRAARNAGDPVAEGHAHLRMSYLSLYGEQNPTQGLQLTGRTADLAKTRSKTLVGLAHLHSAEAHAMLGSTRPCEAALASAESAFDTIAPSDPAAHLFSPHQLNRLAGSCYLVLGDHHRAQRILDRASTQMTTRSKSRAIVLGNLSLTHLHKHDLDAATGTLHRAIDLLETTRGGGGLNIVFDAARQLHPWRAETVVHDLHDRLLSLMTTT